MTTLPYSEEAEGYVLGSMLWSRRSVGRALEILSAEDFIEPKHRLLFRTLHNMYLEGEDIDPLLVAERLRKDGQADKVAADDIIELLDEAGSSMFLESHAQLILHRSNSRSLSRVVQEPHKLSNEEIEQAAEKADDLLRRMRQGEQEPTKPIGAWLARDLEEIEQAAETDTRLVGISTGFSKLDETTAGWEAGQLVVVGAQTGIGKTSLMLRFALEAAKQGNRVLFFSLEMTAKELRQRIYAQEAHLNLSSVRLGNIEGDGWNRLTKVSDELSRLPLEVCGRRGMTVEDIAAECRRKAGDGPLGLVVVDYLQLIHADRKLQRYEQVGEIARDLKQLAGELHCAVITGSQLSRKVEERPDKRPLKSDLRESGDIEHTADIILLLHWPWKHNPQSKDIDPSSVELLIAKNRQGRADFGYEIRYVAEQTLHYEVDA